MNFSASKKLAKVERLGYLPECSKAFSGLPEIGKAERLHRSCNRQDVRLFNNRLRKPFCSELAGFADGRDI